MRAAPPRWAPAGYWKDTIPATGNESDTLTRYYVVKRSAKQTDIAATALIPSTSHEQETESGKNRQGRAPGGKRLPRQLELGQHQRLLLRSLPHRRCHVDQGRLDDYQTDCRDADQMILKVDLSDLDLTTNRSLQLKVGE